MTYKWLSKELEIHVNLAKLILWRYWQQCKNDTLVATFMLIGNLKDGGMRVEVVKDSDVKIAKEKFDKIVSEHIYSLQKALPDIELLAGSGKGDSRYSAITCENSVIFSDEELLTMRWGKSINPLAIPIEKKDTDSPSSKRECPTIEEASIKSDRDNGVKVTSDEKSNKKISPLASQKNEKKGAVSKKPVQTTKAGFSHLFGKAGNQQKSESAVCGSFANGPRVSKARQSFSKSSPERSIDRPAVNDKLSEPINKENYDGSSSTKKLSVSSTLETKNLSKGNEKNVEKTTVSKKYKAKKNNKSLRGTKRERSNDSEEETKKRKRIIEVTDSSEESAAASDNEDIFASPEQQPPRTTKSSSPPVIEKSGNKRKIRKLVDKTFLDEDGYLVTKKESVYESCSDEEPEVLVTVNKKSEHEKVKEPIVNVKKKQTSLMSFFKRA